MMASVPSTSVIPPSSSPSSLKRARDEDASAADLLQAPPAPSIASTPLLTPPVSHSNHSSPSKTASAPDRAVSPSLSSLTSISGDQADAAPTGNAVPGAAPQKRRKLTPAEKQQRQQEKDAKAKERAEAKAKRDEEKRVEEEEKQRKRAEREEKKKQKEFEDQQKKQEKEQHKQEKELLKQKEEEEKRKKEEEKQKKERSQLRLNSFFVKPKEPAPASVTTITEGQSSGETVEAHKDGDGATKSASVSPQKPRISDYDAYFLPFSLAPTATLAPWNHFHPQDDITAMDEYCVNVEQAIRGPSSSKRDWIQSFTREASADQQHRVLDMPVQDIIARLHGSSNAPIDLTDEEFANVDESPLQLLKAIPLKYIHFMQDVRPPYYGTCTKLQPAKQARKLSRNSWAPLLANTDYGYDSEAEWEEPEEGEDIASDGEESESDGEDDMKEFLDDENDSPNKKRAVVNVELQPDSSGICWEDGQAQMRRADGSVDCPSFHGFRLGVLLEHKPCTIDPFSTSYWEREVDVTNTVLQPTANPANGATTMQPPPRVPLQARPNGGNSRIMEDFTGKAAPALAPTPAKPGPKPAVSGNVKVKRMVPPEQLDDFKKAVEGSDMTKLALIEDLKKKFPKLPKDAINNTLSTIAARVGAKEVEKRWVLL